MNKSFSRMLSILFVLTPLSCTGQNQRADSAPPPSLPASSHPDAHPSLPAQYGKVNRYEDEVPLQKVEASSLLLQVDNISPRFCSRPGTTEAIVKLRIKNVGTSAFRIPISGFTGKGGESLNYGGRKPAYSISLGGEWQPTAGSSAVINYQWRNQLSNVVTSGTCSLSNGMIVLAPNENQLITFAVMMPIEPGTYSLVIEFDNRDVWLSHQGYNSRILSERAGGLPRPLYCHQSTSVPVEVSKATSTP